MSAFDFLEAMPDAVLLTNPNGVVTIANSRAVQVLGLSRRDLLNSPIERFGLVRHHPADSPGPASRSADPTKVDIVLHGKEFTVRRWSLGTEFGAYDAYTFQPSEASGERPSEEALSRFAYHTEILETLNEAFVIVDNDGALEYANEAAACLIGAEREALNGLDLYVTLARPADASAMQTRVRTHFLDEVLESGTEFKDVEALLRCSDDSRVDVAVNARPLISAPGRVDGAAISFSDISQRKRVELQYAVQERVLQMLARGDHISETGRVLVDFIEEAIAGSRAVLYLLDRDSHRIELVASDNVPREIEEVLHQVVRENPVSAFGQALRNGQTLVFEDLESADAPHYFLAAAREFGLRAFWAYPVRGSSGNLLGTVTVFRGPAGLPTQFDAKVVDSVVGLGRMLVDRKQFERDLAHQTFNDELTGLPDRILMMDRLHVALQRAKNSDSYVALLLVDLNQFQMINDSLGMAAGDQVLRETAQRLRASLRSDDLVARFTGDEFGVVLEQINGETDAINVVMRIQRGFATPVTVEGVDIYVSFSVGIALSTEPDLDADTLVRYADIAMHRAKESGHGKFAVFSPSQDLTRVPKIELQSRLHRALAADALQLHYQPVMSLQSAKIAGYEALVRWHDEQYGDVSPDEFLPLAQRSGIMSEITAWVLDRAVSQLTKWQDHHGDPLLINVNISPEELDDPLLIEQVAAVIERYQLDPWRLVLEMTEHALVDRSGNTHEIVQRLRGLGVRIALDDFGTGYSSLAYLERFPVDCVKIDRSFIHSARGGASSSPVAAAMVTLARDLGMISIAEGIETEEDERVARKLGCDFSQGYYYGRPLPGSALDAWYESNHRDE